MKRLPVHEMFYLPTRPVSLRKIPVALYRLVFLLGILFIFALIADSLGLTDIARAQTIPVIHDNAYYCSLIKETGEQVVGANQDDITKLCANLK